MPRRVFIPLAITVLVGAYLITVWTDGAATAVGFFLLIGAFMAVHFFLRRAQ
jgi:hypothetical protein